MNRTASQIPLFFIAISFFLSLVIPTTFQSARGVILVIIVSALLGAIISGVRWRIDKNILLFSILTISFSILQCVHGLANGAPGAVSVSRVYVLWPLLYLFLFGFCRDIEQFVILFKVVLLGAFASASMGIFLVLGVAGLIPADPLSTLKSQGATIGIYDGHIEYNIYNTTTLIFSFPFLIAFLSFPSLHPFFHRRWVNFGWFCFFLTVIAILISGRRMFWVVASLSPLIVLVIFAIANQSLNKLIRYGFIGGALIFAVGSVAASLIGLNVDNMVGLVIDALDFSSSKEESANVRGKQLVDLLGGWSESPFLGVGHGMPAPNIVRSLEQPWAYELSYVALLYHVGVLGFLVYAIPIIWIFCRTIQISKKDRRFALVALPFLAGMTGFLMTNASNPYLEKFDYLWVIFLPVALINAAAFPGEYIDLERSEDRNRAKWS